MKNKFVIIEKHLINLTKVEVVTPIKRNAFYIYLKNGEVLPIINDNITDLIIKRARFARLVCGNKTPINLDSEE